MQLRKVNTERKTPEIEKRSVTSRYRGSKISGSQQYGAKQRRRQRQQKWQKSNRFILAKKQQQQQLITPFCTFRCTTAT